MIGYSEDPETGIAEIVIDGRITRAEFDDVSAHLTALIERRGRIRLLEDIRRLGWFDPSIIPHDLRFTIRHMKDFSHCAVVGEHRWIRWLVRAFDPLTRCEIRYFDRAEIEGARHWLRHEPG